MKRFLFSILFVTVFCIGLGALVDKAGATFKSDEKALALIQKARQAIGGDSAINNIQSMVIVGKTTRNFKIDGADRSEQGETEIAMQLPDKLMKMIKIGHDDGTGDKVINKQVDVVVVAKGAHTVSVKGEDSGSGTGTGVKKIVIKKDDGTVQEFTGAEAEKIIAADGDLPGDNVRKIVIKKPDGTVETLTGDTADKVVVRGLPGDKAVWTAENGKTINVDGNHVFMRRAGDNGLMKHNEMLRLTLSLLITAPQGMDVSYTFGGESSVDGTACNIVNAEFAGATFKLYLGQTSNLPVMMTYTGMKMPMMMKFKADGAKSGEPKDKEHTVFLRKVDGPPAETAEFNVKFSDYRSVNGMQLPFKWTQTVGGAADETFDVTSYDINPANIADKFKSQKVIVRTKKPDVQ